MITADQVREWLREFQAPQDRFTETAQAEFLADRINAALALAVAGAYEDAAQAVRGVREADRLRGYGFNEMAAELRQRTPTHARAALEAERERVWQQATKTAADKLLELNPFSYERAADEVRALKRPEALR